METKAEVVEIVKKIGSVWQLKNYPEEDLYLEVFLYSPLPSEKELRTWVCPFPYVALFL